MTKTMQPVLPKLFSLESASPDWWYKMRQQTNQLVEEMIVRRGNDVKHISVELQESEHTMNEQGEWECQHASAEAQEFLDDLGSDDDILMLNVCTVCERYFDERDSEWKY